MKGIVGRGFDVLEIRVYIVGPLVDVVLVFVARVTDIEDRIVLRLDVMMMK